MVVVVSDIVVPVTTDKSNHLVVFPPLRTVEVEPVVRVAAAHGDTVLAKDIKTINIMIRISADPSKKDKQKYTKHLF